MALHFDLIELSGSGANDLTDVDRLIVKANNQPIIDVTGLQLRAWLNRYAPRGSFGSIALTDTSFTLPLFNMAEENEILQDRYQFLAGAGCQVELQLGAGTVAGEIHLGWTKTDVDPAAFIALVGQPMNVAAAINNAKVPFNTRGAFQGFGIPTTGLERVRLVVDGVQLMHGTGPSYAAAAPPVSRGLYREFQSLQAGANLSEPWIHDVGFPDAAPNGSSYLELATAAGWAGVTNEMLLYTISPNGEG